MTTATPVARARAVRNIGDAIADRTSFVIVVSPDMNETAAVALDGIPATVYVDNGIDVVLRTDDPRLILPMDVLTGCAVVVLVPKTIPATELSEALGRPIPDDGSQDIIYLMDNQARLMGWPRMFIDALKRVDPAMAESIRAAAL